MNYQSEYNFYYDKIYSKIERGVKGYYILQNNKKRSFGITHNEIRIFLSNDLAKDFFLNLNEELKQLLEIFNNRFTYYKENQINFIFENEIKAAFDKLNKDDFPKNYSLKKLIFEIAFTKAKMEISRLLHNNSNIFELFYDLGKFENFEIKEYSPISVERTEIYIQMYKQLHPEEKKVEYSNFVLTTDEEYDTIDFTKTSIPKSIAMLKACGFFELESVKNISSSKLHQIVGIIIGLDPNNTTHMRSLRGNINVMNKKSEENPLKFTTSNHIEQMMKLLK